MTAYARRLMFDLGRGPNGRNRHVFDLLDAFSSYRTELEHSIDNGTFAPGSSERCTPRRPAVTDIADK